MPLADDFQTKAKEIDSAISAIDDRIIEAVMNDQPVFKLIAERNQAVGEKIGIEWASYRLEADARDKEAGK